MSKFFQFDGGIGCDDMIYITMYSMETEQTEPFPGFGSARLAGAEDFGNDANTKATQPSAHMPTQALLNLPLLQIVHSSFQMKT